MSQRDEIIAKGRQHVAEHFGGDWLACARHYDWSQDEKLDETEIRVFLRAAGVGRITAQFAAPAIVQELDTDKDGAVSVAELVAAFNKPE